MLIKAELLREMLILTVLWQALKCDFQVLGGKKRNILLFLIRGLQKKHILVTSCGALA